MWTETQHLITHTSLAVSMAGMVEEVGKWKGGRRGGRVFGAKEGR